MPDEEKVRVLIVDDIEETRENIRRFLMFDSAIEVVGAARSGQEAISMAQKLTPDVVIMDINMPDMDGITATEGIRKKIPYTQVVILSVQSDPSYMRRAMLAGARDFLTKPPSIDELTAAIHRAGAVAVDERKRIAATIQTGSLGGMQPGTGPLRQTGWVIVVYSPKGGTGCTTLATNLALTLQSEGSKTLLVDGNLQFGDVAVVLNEQVKNSVLDLTTRVDELDEEVITSVLINHSASGLQVLPAPPVPELAESVRGEDFGKLLVHLKKIFNYIIVDTASYMTEVVQSALEKADLILLVTTQDIPSIKNAHAFLNLADASGISRNDILFVMNRFDKRILITPDKLGESMKQPVAAVIPLDERVVTSSINRGIPFIQENKAFPISKAVIAMAEAVRAKLEQEIQETT
jgi:pilus assembly protein CpaE